MNCSRFADREQFISDLKKLGFSQVTYEDSYIWHIFVQQKMVNLLQQKCKNQRAIGRELHSPANPFFILEVIWR